MALIGRKTKRRRTAPQAYVIEEARDQATSAAPVSVHAQSSRARHSRRVRQRIQMCGVVFVFAFSMLGVRLALITFDHTGDPHQIARASLEFAERPEIVDRQGALLAMDLPMIALEIAGREVWDYEDTARAIAQTLSDVDAAALEAKLRAGRYVEVRSDLSPAEREAVFNLGLPGVRFATRTKRAYPHGPLAAHVIGNAEAGRGGVMGLEKVANAFKGGAPLMASIDIRVQQTLEKELSAACAEYDAKAAWGVVMDAETGEVIALASLPDFDPNAPGAAPDDFRRNRVTYDRYELGSAFKAISAAAALDAGVASEDSGYDARGSFRIADRRITDLHGENRMLTFSEVVQHSSNIGIARIAADLGADAQKSYLRALGMFEPLAIELNENRAPDLPTQWGPVENATIAYGHGIAVTPLHLLAGFTAVVNGGDYIGPTFLAASAERSRARVFKSETSAAMRRVLRRVITDGTGGAAEVDGYFPIGKTATADKPAFGGYDESARIASFVGAFPGYAPKYTVLISLDDPQPTRETFGFATAGWNAAPVFSRVVERIAPVLNVASVSESVALAAFVSGAVEPVHEARAPSLAPEAVQ
ncbi:MAG: penicillin-binding protein 2 [Pseudomonadota bacterium]